MDIAASESQVTEGCVTLPSPPQTAAHAVLFTPELLCNVIAQLPLGDIVTATGVCHFWRNAAAAEPEIQKALFLIPEKVSRKLVMNRTYLRDLEEYFFESGPGEPIPEFSCFTIGRLHPFLPRICGLFNTREIDYQDWENNVSNLEYTQDFCHPNSSWRDMFISQPPCQFIVIDRAPSWRRGFFGRDTYTDMDGVRLGDLYDKISSLIATKMEFDRPHDEEEFARMHVDLTFLIEYYSNVGDGIPAGTMEVPVRDGVAVFPEKLVWTGAEKK
jgi:hypothetical protein